MLPILVPIGAVTFAFSMTAFCCLRQQFVRSYVTLENRIYHLEQTILPPKINSDMPFQSGMIPMPTIPTYPAYTGYLRPTAPTCLV